MCVCVCVCVCVHAVSRRQTGFAVTPTVNPGAKADSKSLRDNEIWSHLLVGLLFFSLFPSLGWDTKRWSALETKNKNKNPNWKRRIVQISRLQSATTRRYLHFPFHGAVSEFVFESLVSWQVWPCGAPPSLKTEMCFLRWGGECVSWAGKLLVNLWLLQVSVFSVCVCVCVCVPVHCVLDQVAFRIWPDCYWIPFGWVLLFQMNSCMSGWAPTPWTSDTAETRGCVSPGSADYWRREGEA